ncbi:hypothetical protein PybrP1_010924 [[Pythium] brassicae (nom. inval.)]|nr:hypothetical protein PybrP1_010924 [[Pythium] brassicae (nom. inval.)]
MHDDDIERSAFSALETSCEGGYRGGGEMQARSSKTEVEDDGVEAEVQEYRGGVRVVIKYVVLRLALVTALVIASVSLRDHFLDLTDFVGASAITFSCLVLPIVFYHKLCWRQIPLFEKVTGVLVVVVCLAVGGYVTYITGKNLFAPNSADPNAPPFPFCSSEHQFEVYYVKG